jgi:hypothetical protein
MMKSMFAALFISIMAMPAQAADALGLETGLFGFSWGESAATIRSRAPQAIVSAIGDRVATIGLKGNFSFAGHAVDVIIMSFDASNRLNLFTFHVKPNEQNALLQQLRLSLGQPRLMSTKEGRIYTHIVEWSRPQGSVSLWAVTTGPQLTDPAGDPVSVRVQRGPLDSEIERVEKQKKALQERFGTGAQHP